MHADIEKAYRKWRATKGKGIGTGRYVRTAAHREVFRQAALRRWERYRRAKRREKTA